MSTKSTPTIQKRKQELSLVNSLMDDFNNKKLTHLYTTDIKLENFEVVKVIGRGSFAKIYLVKKFENDN